MGSPLMNQRHQMFLLDDVLDVGRLGHWSAFAGQDRDDWAAVLASAHALAVQYFAPHHRLGDVQEPHLHEGKVVLPAAVETALSAYASAGFNAAAAPVAQGGMGLPYVIALASDGLFMAANIATSGYALLTRGAAHLLLAHGSESQIRRFAKPLLEGRYFGTMCLSEPQAGSSLGDVSTRAVLQPDGSYRLEGSKMWISGGEHEMGENIIHLVLARVVGDAPGVRGLSLFVVPRLHVDAAGCLGARNDVHFAGLNHKLGQRGIVNTFLKFGEQGQCHGELIGERGGGLAAMFHMMNEARIGVGMGATMSGMASYRYALRYARERRQGRSLEQRDPTQPQILIIEHVEVRRLLLRQRALVEGAHALCLFAGLQVDIKAHAPEASTRQRAAALLDLLTPIVKAWSAEFCVQASDHAIQVLGGYGYTREYPVELYWRDNRLNPIHEGTNGIQAIDLLGRKVLQDDGVGLRIMLDFLRDSCADAPSPWQPFATALMALGEAIQRAVMLTKQRLKSSGPVRALADAHDFMIACGHCVVGALWLRQALVAERLASKGDDVFLSGKRKTAQYFWQHELPDATAAIGRVLAGQGSVADVQDAEFGE
jgi:alkylation response protein AidB-like acyl-CoA dehydrogenase